MWVHLVPQVYKVSSSLLDTGVIGTLAQKYNHAVEHYMLQTC